MRILLLSPYHTHSHAYWCQGLLQGIPQHEWTLQSLPARNFSWRIRGNALSWYGENRRRFQENYQVVLATSMTDLASLLALFPHLQKAKKILYFHENQFAYPLSGQKKHSNVESMMVQLYSSLAADLVVFNSEYNRRSFQQGAKELLRRIGDHSPVEVLQEIQDKSRVIPVPIPKSLEYSEEKIPRAILWNHRWEYDKNPEDFLGALKLLQEDNQDFRIILMGLEFRNKPRAMREIQEQFGPRLLCAGQQNTRDYHNWLNRASMVVSTAIHEFQGLAVMEAVQQGAHPLVPDRLSYPEWFPEKYRYGQDSRDLARAIKEQLDRKPQPPDLSHLSWEALEDRYIELLQ